MIISIDTINTGTYYIQKTNYYNTMYTIPYNKQMKNKYHMRRVPLFCSYPAIRYMCAVCSLAMYHIIRSVDSLTTNILLVGPLPRLLYIFIFISGFLCFW